MDSSISTYASLVGKWLAAHGARIAVILVFMYIGIRLSGAASARLFSFLGRRKAMDEEYKKRADTLSSVLGYLLSATIVTVAVLMILSQLRIEIGPVLAAAGVLGVAVGFGAQHLVQDVISGFFILLDDEIRVGDVARSRARADLLNG